MTRAAEQCPIPCNLCGSVDVEAIGALDRDGRPLRTTICRKCGLVWSNPRPSEEEVRNYYSREYRLDYKGAARPSLRHTARSGRGALNRYRELAPYLKPSDKVLDAGAGGGEVVYVLRRMGFDAQGIEPDEQYARYAREELSLPVATGFIQDATFPAGAFDVVTLYHALEHVEDPVGILTNLGGWMKSGGVLLVEVPNVEARCIAPGHRFHFAHFYSFNPVSLEAVGRKAGFSPIRTTISPDGGNVTTVFRRAPGAQASALPDEANYRRVSTVVRGHTDLRYYCSRAPYAGPIGRLRSFLADRAAARGCQTATQVLDALIQRSKAAA